MRYRDSIKMIKIEDIYLTGWNPRKNFDEQALQDLSKSIKAQGILEPIIVRPNAERYQLVCGERRYRASQMAGLTSAPCMIKEMDDQQVREVMIIENLQREDLAPMEEAACLEILLKDKKGTQQELADRLGKTQGWIANRLRLLKAPAKLKELIISRKIMTKQALAVLSFEKYPVFKDIMDGIKEHIQEYGAPTMDKTQGVIDLSIRGANKKKVLDLTMNRGDYWSERWWFYFNKKPCKKCKKNCEVGRRWGKEKNTFCLDPKCFIPKKVAAKKKLKEREKIEEKEKVEERKAAQISTKVKTARVKFDSWRHKKIGEKFEGYICTGCPKKLKFKGKAGEYCSDSECYHNKEIGQKRSETILMKKLYPVAREALYKAIDDFELPRTDFKPPRGKKRKAVVVPLDLMRSILETITRYGAPGDRYAEQFAYKPFGESAKYFPPRWGGSHKGKKLPEDKIEKILISLIWHFEIMGNDRERKDRRFILGEDLERVVPSAMKYYTEKADEVKRIRNEKRAVKKKTFLNTIKKQQKEAELERLAQRKLKQIERSKKRKITTKKTTKKGGKK